MDITLAILYIHPTFEFWVDFKVINDWIEWSEDEIVWKNEEIEQPTTEALNAAWVEVEKEQRIAEISKEMRKLRIAINGYWWNTNQLTHIVLDAIDASEIAELEARWNVLETELDTYNQSLVSDIMYSLFG